MNQFFLPLLFEPTALSRPQRFPCFLVSLYYSKTISRYHKVFIGSLETFGRPCLQMFLRKTWTNRHRSQAGDVHRHFQGLGTFVFMVLWHGKVSALVLQVSATQACGIKLAFAMCLLQCPHCTDEAHIGRNRAPCLHVKRAENTIEQNLHPNCLYVWKPEEQMHSQWSEELCF